MNGGPGAPTSADYAASAVQGEVNRLRHQILLLTSVIASLVGELEDAKKFRRLSEIIEEVRRG